MKKHFYKSFIISIIAIMLASAFSFASSDVDTKPIDDSQGNVVSKQMYEKDISNAEKRDLEQFFINSQERSSANNSNDSESISLRSYSNPVVDSEGFVKVYYPETNDVYHLDGSIYVDYEVFDTWTYYFTIPMTGVFDSNNDLIDFSVGEVAEVGMWNNYTGSRYLNPSLYTNGDYTFVVMSVPCDVYGEPVEGWSSWSNIPMASVPFKIGHIWGSYTVTKKSTYAAVGSKSARCEVCGKVKKATIPKLTVKATAITKLTPAKKAFTVKWKKCSSVTGYEIQYALNSKFTKNCKTKRIAKANKISKKITKLKAKKKYYVRVRAYKTYKGKKYYSKWSKVKKVVTKK